MRLNDARYKVLASAATAAPANAIDFRVLLAMLSRVDGDHWLRHRELVSHIELDEIEARTLVSKNSICKARRRLAAMGMIVRLTPAHLHGRPTVWTINVAPLVPLPFPHRMKEALASKKRLGDLARRDTAKMRPAERERILAAERREGAIDQLNGHVVRFEDPLE
jgi:hypothetical protein